MKNLTFLWPIGNFKCKFQVDFTIQLDESGSIASLKGSSTIPLADKIEQLERELERKEEEKVRIQQDYNELCEKVSFCRKKNLALKIFFNRIRIMSADFKR